MRWRDDSKGVADEQVAAPGLVVAALATVRE
jgi:hypothetical protein